MPTDPKGKTPTPAAEPSATAVVLLLVGLLIGYGIKELVEPWLDDAMRDTQLWRVGRFGLVGLFGWMGWLFGVGKGRVVAENIECLAIAVVMALILKHFLLEAYKIPTGSMQPTILGNDEAQIFDRVLVNKFAYLVAEPERYDVIVFKYPLNRSQNYIKRLIGLSGERVRIENGDVFVAHADARGEYGPFEIARKPRSARDAMLKTLYPSGRSGETFESTFEVRRGKATPSGDGVDVAADSLVRYGHGESVRDQYLDGYDPDWGITGAGGGQRPSETENVGDLTLAFDVTPDANCKEVRLVVFANQREHRAVLGVGTTTRIESGKPGASDAYVGTNGGSPIVATLDRALLKAGSSTRVEFIHVDQELIVVADGDEVLRYAYDGVPTSGSAETGIEFEVVGGGAHVEDLRVRRDIHYTKTGLAASDKGVFQVPADGLLAMGDNTQNSSDGRVWRGQEVRFADGTVTYRDATNSGMFGVGELTDIYGETYQITGASRATFHEVQGDRFHYVPRKLLLGKALAVFWPIVPHFRWKLLR